MCLKKFATRKVDQGSHDLQLYKEQGSQTPPLAICDKTYYK